MKSLYDKLHEYGKSDYIPFHMPGHKRNSKKFGLEEAAGIDITEIDGFDDYHYPQGIIRDVENQASVIYGSDKSFYLVNGSSGGILIAISAVSSYGDSIIVARNCHKAVYNAVYINNLNPEYIYPVVDEYTGIMGQVKPQEVKEALEKTGAKVVVITSPTYEGIVSDVNAIADICHEKGAVLIVDEAHGAHFNFHKVFPKTAIECGADLIIESLHKTLPSYTQTAILHVSGNLVDVKKVQRFLSIYQTSSPSYIFMAGMNKCIDYMVSPQGMADNDEYVEALKKFREKLKTLKNIRLFEAAQGIGVEYDISKIVLLAPKKGVFIYDELLEKYHIQLEMTSMDYVIAMTSIGDEFSWYEKMYNALKEIDEYLNVENEAYFCNVVKAKVIMNPHEAFGCGDKVCEIAKSCGKVAKEWVYAYPPGIPLIYPGEEITEELLVQMNKMKEAGVSVKVLQDEKGETILCIE